jgi:tetratricopeptide (TPR) repeat protein/CHAT domain-containing protein
VRLRILPGPGVGALLAIAISVLAPRPATAQPPAAVVQPAPALTAAEAQRVFTDVLRRYFEAYARQDLNGMVAEWHPAGPAHSRRNIVVVEFDLRQVELTGLTLTGASADAGGGRARAVIDLAVKDKKTGSEHKERRVRDFTLLPDDSGAWKIWNEVTPAGELARRLLAAPEDERGRLIASDPELASTDTLTGLSTEAGHLQGLSRWRDAVEVLRVETLLARALGDDHAIGQSLLQTGSTQMLIGQRPEAREAFTAARDAFVAEGSAADIAACDANLANLSYIMGKFPDAAAGYQQAFDTFERLNDDAGMASSLHGLGNALYMQTEFGRALQCYTRALAILERTKDAYRQASVLQAIAMVNKELGDYAPAIDAWRRSMALSESGGDAAGAAKALAGLGELYRLEGDLGRALQFQAQALQRWNQLENAGESATANYAIGQLRALQRDLTGAVESYHNALDLDRSITDDAATSESGQARDLGGLGGAHFVLGQFDTALSEYQESLALREKLADQPGVMWTLVHMGILHASQHRAEEAGQAYARALGIAEPANDANAVSTILALRGRLELDQDQVDAALTSASRAVEIATSIEHFDTVSYAEVVAGRAHQKAGRLTEAQAAFEEAAAAVVKVPMDPAADTFFDDRRTPYLALVDLLADQGQTAEAFRWSERGRQRALADLLGGDGAIVTRGMTVEEQQAERSVERDVRTLSVKIRRAQARKTPDVARIAELQATLAARQTDREALRQKLYTAHPALRDLRAQGEARGADAASVLDMSAAGLLSFVVGEARTWVFAVAKGPDPAGWAVQQAAAIDVKASDLAQQVRRFREAIATKDEKAPDLARELYALLVEPVGAVVGKKTRVVVVPDGCLWSLPFEALQGGGGHFLVESAAVSYAPSLTALAVLEAAKPDAAARRTLVAFGLPEIVPADADRLAVVRVVKPAPAASPAPPSREVQDIAALFGPSRSRLYVGAKAQAGQLAQGVPPGAILHLGLPAVLTDATPLFSLLAFSNTGAADTSTGLVEVAALMTWDLPAVVTVASQAEFVQGVGDGGALSAMAWSLLVAGSPTLVIDRWTAPPTGPSVTTRFYRAHLAPLGPGARPPRAAESLQKAMKGILAQPATRQPLYWAGAMAIGR